MTLPSRQNLDDSLARIRSLLDKQDLVRGLVHKTEMRRHEVVEDLVAAQYRANCAARSITCIRLTSPICWKRCARMSVEFCGN